MSRFTVLGGTGFIGSHLAAELRARGRPVAVPPRDADLTGADLGTVFYCIGLTADFRHRPFDTVTAHVEVLHKLLRSARFDRLVYLSSTRVYPADGSGAATEDAPLTVRPTEPGDLYNLSKLMGESLALTTGRPTVVARVSNVYGPDLTSENFLTSLITDAVRTGVVRLRSDPRSAKDYVSVKDVVGLLIDIGERGRDRVYNVASGRNVSHGYVLERLRELTGCQVELAGGALAVFPPIDVSKARREFGYAPASLGDELAPLVALYRERLPAATGGP
jgi:nucleoside-diphosphate-sugar epimerase